MDLRTIPGHPGYFASADGDIYSNVRRGRPSADRLAREEPLRRLVPGVSAVRGYRRYQVALGRGRSRKVARLVALAFLGPSGPGFEVAHLNGDSLDNRAVNLAWKTKIDNEADKVGHGTTNRGRRHGASKLTDDDIRAIRSAFRSGERQKDIGARYGVSQGHISMICNRRQWAWLD